MGPPAADDAVRGVQRARDFVELPAGSSVSSIANRLVAAGVLPDAITFRLAARHDRRGPAPAGGRVRFAGPSTPLQVLDRLAAGDVYTHALTFREGLTVFEMADVFERSGLGSADDFLTAARNRTLVDARDPRAVARGLPVSGRIRVAAIERRGRSGGRNAGALRQGVRQRAARRGGKSRHEHARGLTLASIIETGRADERTKVSAVCHNRLKIGMPLQCDPR